MAISAPTGTDWQVATDSDFTDIIVNDVGGGYSLTKQFERGGLPYGQSLYIRARHVHPDLGETEWSNPVRFTVGGWVIGLCLDDTDPTVKGQWYYIDKDGNKLDSFDWQSHPTWAGIEMAVIDADRAPVTMTKFPKFYIKWQTSGPSGTFAAGLKCVWICDQAKSDFGVFRAFGNYNSSVSHYPADYVYIGTYLGHTEYIDSIEVLGSKYGQTVALSNLDPDNYRFISDGASNRNDENAGVSGFVDMSIYQLAMLQLLGLFMCCSTDFRTAFGDNTDGFTTTGSTKARLVFKGTQDNPEVFVDDLWNCEWCFVGGYYGMVSPNYSRYDHYVVNFTVMLTAEGEYTNSLSLGFTADVDSVDKVSLYTGWLNDLWAVWTTSNTSETTNFNFAPRLFYTDEQIEMVIDDSSIATYSCYCSITNTPARTLSPGDYSPGYCLFHGGSKRDTTYSYNDDDSGHGMFAYLIKDLAVSVNTALRLVKF